MKEILHWTQRFFAGGIAIVPLFHRSKLPIVAWEEFKNRLPTTTEYRSWFTTGWNNYGVVGGWNNLAFLDFDDHTAFALWLDWYATTGRELPFIVRSARGAHVYFSTSARGANHRRLGCDVKFHGYVVGPGSTHPSGTQYVACGELHFLQVDCLEQIMPNELFPVQNNAFYSDNNHSIYQNLYRMIKENGEEGAPHHTEYQYDPFAAASMVDGEDLITKVKRCVKIETLFPDARRTSGNGQWFAVKCLFHEDNNPSAWVDVHRQLYGCNVCGMKPMDCINLFARMRNISERAAVSELAREVGVWK